MRKYLYSSLFLLASFLIVNPLSAANRFWVSAVAGNWNVAANWSATSGGAGGATVPGAGDVAIFDGAGGANGDCNIVAATSVGGISITTFTGILFQNNNLLTVGATGYAQASGIFVGGAANLDLNGNFTLSGGTFNCPLNTFFVGGTRSASATIFTHSAGTYKHNNGIISFDPANNCANYTYTIDVINTTQFYDVIISGTGSCGTTATITTAVSDTVEAQNNLTHTDGRISGLIEVYANFTINGNVDGGTGTIIFNGGNAQTYSTTGAGLRTCYLKVNKTASALTPAGGTTELACQSFTLTQGSFTAPSGNLQIGGSLSASTTLFTHSAGTFAHNSGTVVIDPVNNCANYTYTLDVLTNTDFYNVTVNGSGSCGTTATITTAANDTVNATNDLTDTDGYITGMFEVKNNLIVGASTDGGSGWIIFNGTGAQTYSINAAAPRICQVKINKSAGAVTPAVGTTDFSVQAFHQILGDFTAPSGNFKIGGTWSASTTIFTHAAGTFSHNSGTVTLDPANNCANYTYTLDVINSTDFYNVAINGTGSCGTTATIATAANDTINAVNDLTFVDGYITGKFEIKNNLIVGASTDGGSGWIIFNGTGAQTYLINAAAPRICQVKINKSSGAVTPAVGTTDFSVQGFHQILGDFTAPSGNFKIGGTWSASTTILTHAAGIFSHNSGTVTLDPANNCANYTYTADVITSTDFYNVTINGTGSCGTTATIATAAGDTINATNDLNDTDGYITGMFEVKNNLIVGASTDGGSGWIIFNGTGAQTYSVNAAAPRICQVKVNKSSGAVTPAVGTTDFSVQGFHEILGDFTAPTGNFKIGGTWSASTTIFTHANGTFTHNSGTVTIDPANNCANYTYTIDVINRTDFYNVIINGTGSCGTTATITTAANDTVNATNDLTDTDGYITGMFEVKNNLIVGASTDGGSGWIIFNGTGAQTYSVNAAAPRICQVKINKSSGAVTPAVGTTDFSVQGFHEILGDFTAPTGNFKIGGTWSASATILTHAAGTFSHNSGTVTLDPANNCANYTYTADVINATAFYNIIINGTGSCGTTATLATAANDTLDATNDLTVTDGFITGKFELKNNLIVNANSDGGSGWIIFDGTGAQTYSINAAAPRICQVKINKSAGAVTPAVGTTDFSVQGFHEILGDFTAPTGNFKIGGTWSAGTTILTHAAGIFSHNSGTVTFDPFNNCANYTYILDVIPSTFFNLVDFNGSGSCGTTATFTITAGDTIDVRNNLTLTNGIINTGFMEAAANVTVGASFDGGTGGLIFGGGSSQDFDLTGATGLFNADVKIRKTANDVTLLSACQLDAANQDLFFVKGKLNSTGTNLLIIGDNVNATGASDSSYVEGPVRKIGNDTFTFPVGDNGYYRSIRISAPGNVAHHFTAEYFDVDPNASYDVTLKDVTLDHISRCEHWILDRTNGASNVNVTLSWRDSTSCDVNVLSELSVARWDGSAWRDHGNGGTTGSASSGTIVTSAVVTAFSPFTLASRTVNNPLPIELLSFTAECKNGKTEINWITASETNNDFFTVEQSENGFEFVPVYFQSGAGNSNSLLHYSTTLSSDGGTHYFRLKQTDHDGNFTYSEIISSNCSNAEQTVSIYPNPTNNNVFTVELTGAEEQLMNVEIRNSLGQVVYSKTCAVNFRTVIEPSSVLAPGIYFVEVNLGDRTISRKLVIE